MRSQITTHILDIAVGKPASGVKVILFIKQEESWKELAHSFSDINGRIEDLLSSDIQILSATYKLVFFPGDYFQKNNRKCFYPSISVCFEIINTKQHYHIPLLLSGFGYSTYRGT